MLLYLFDGELVVNSLRSETPEGGCGGPNTIGAAAGGGGPSAIGVLFALALPFAESDF